jgi:regulator of protease activity HflC (stomatin/prohibitin superfamily)
MFFFIVGIIFALIAVGVLLIPSAQFKEKGVTVFAVWVLAVIFLGISCLTVVGTKKVGVVTSFNKPVGTLSNGIHTKWPWQKVHELDGAIQTDNHLCAGGPENKGGGILVRIGNQSVACLDVTVRWRIRQAHSDALYRDYRSFDHIRDSLVTRDLNQALNDVFVDYNPLGNLNSNKPTPPPSLEALGTRVKTLLVGDDGNGGRIGDQIEVLSIFIPIVHHDDQTQTKINQYQAAKADTRIALQKVQTAVNEAKANKTLASSVSRDPNVLVSKCLDLVAKAGTNLPAGFTCWPGGGSAVVVPGTTQRR